ncbi:MAG: CocE/NonD family hydrolase, partial [Chloroflexota bacterium]
MAEKGSKETGVFYDSPVQGLIFKTETESGRTNEKGEFTYRVGDTVTFSIEGIILGSCLGKEMVTPADLVPEAAGFVANIINQKVSNMSRFLQSLDEDGDVEDGITISTKTRRVVNKYKGKINFEQSEEDFSTDTNVVALFKELGVRLRSAAEARNHLRRSILGIRKMTDVKVPMRDGTYLLADVFRPIAKGRYPVVMNVGVYGKAFIRGCIFNEEDQLNKERDEDRFFEGNPDHFHYENHETVNTSSWVPRGYVVVRIDGRGICNTPGAARYLSVQEAEDFYDAIEWAAKQTWSNGRIGLWGASYYAMNQLGVASFQPPSLKAIIPIATDLDMYRDVNLPGGIWNEQFSRRWTRDTRGSTSRDREVVTHRRLVDEGFYVPEAYGFKGTAYMGADADKITVPMLCVMPQSHTGHIHVRGSSEIYIQAASKHKQLEVIHGNFIGGYSYQSDTVGRHMAFFDYWLKGVDNGVMNEPPVKIMLQTGNREYTWRFENEWPIARTKYTCFYLDATASGWKGDGKKNDFMILSATRPGRENVTTYSADVNLDEVPCWAHGVSFVTEPLTEDMEIAGYIKLVLWVSSTTKDMDIFASVRVMDSDNKEVPYTLSAMSGESTQTPGEYPVGLGWLKVSHRKLDAKRSTEYRPYHTHLKEDYSPLSSNDEVVEVEVELWPTTALLKRGHRIRLDVQPTDGCGHGTRLAYDESYHKGA